MKITVYDYMATTDKIFELAKERGYNKAQLADITDVTMQAVYKWARHDSSPSLDNIVLLSGVFGVDINEILMTKTVEMHKHRDFER